MHVDSSNDLFEVSSAQPVRVWGNTFLAVKTGHANLGYAGYSIDKDKATITSKRQLFLRIRRFNNVDLLY